MKNLIILSIFIFFISITCVCASELNQSDFQTADIDDKTFSDLEKEINNCSSGDTISLNNDYYFNENYTVEGINISKNLTIEGNGHIIDALNESRIFNINNNTTIILNNIIFKNGYASDGAAIKFSQICENCKIINCIFENNIAVVNCGAIDYLQIVANNEIRNNTFINNMAKIGGAINFEDELYYSIFENNTFINNSVTKEYDGGAIYLNSTSYNKTYIGIADNGNALIIMAPLTAGTYEAYITYSGDENYDCDTCKAIINVSSKINIDAKDVVKYYKGPERFIVNITQDTKGVSNKSIEITINGVSYKRTTDENGIASIALNLESGEYEVITLVDDKTIISHVTIKSTINSTDIVKIFRNDTQFLLTCVDSEGNPLKNSTVTFNIHGVFYNRTTDENGVAKLNINLEPGEYIITTINTFTGEMKANKIIVLTQFIEHGDLIKKYGDATPYTIRLAAKDGSIAGEGCKVTFNINGVFYTRSSNSTGHVSLNINLQQGQYIITSVYMDEMISDKITVY